MGVVNIVYEKVFLRTEFDSMMLLESEIKHVFF